MRRMSCAAVAVAVVLACASACAAKSAGGSPSPPPAGSASAPARVEAPSAAPSGPCAGGACQIEVGVGDVVVVPERYGLGPIEITAISGTTVEMVAPVTGSGFGVSGCSGGGGVSSQGGGGVRLRCQVHTAGTVNDVMSLEVVEVRGTTAVLRIKPAG
ncbi:hypothetical protein [Dactylosporangium matsuzakiense]|uniref:hypothetical protein n=1 Tax=Dactylosporangium matsuzakiense TaxID=53360 RepID=UPI0021C26DC9|nr:hypothetical protein [Dactylosporangium matsuzakiense]UWZ48561.1 hypothetical protein Dmats_20435 [Dactylosporangium matsuzakiense]